MISGVEELDAVPEMLAEAKRELRREGDAVQRASAGRDHDRGPLGRPHLRPPRPPGGFLLHRHQRPDPVHDRGGPGNERIAYLYDPFHPGVLRLLGTTIDNAHASGIPVGMCGEMAADPLATVVLLGLGLDSSA